MIRCQRRTRKGGAGFVVDCRPDGVWFAVRMQTSEDDPAAEFFDVGRIDTQKPHTKKRIETERVMAIINSLAQVRLSPVPAIGGGFGGSDFSLSISHIDNKISFGWWLDCPPEWQAVGDAWQAIVDLATP